MGARRYDYLHRRLCVMRVSCTCISFFDTPFYRPVQPDLFPSGFIEALYLPSFLRFTGRGYKVLTCIGYLRGAAALSVQ